MLKETPSVPKIVSHNALLIQGIIYQLTFMKCTPEHQGPDDDAEWCQIKVKDEWQDSNHLIFYGHNRTELSAERQGKEQEFLLLRRNKFYSALMLIDWEGDTVTRAGVASLWLVNLGVEDLWTIAKPEVRLIKLT